MKLPQDFADLLAAFGRYDVRVLVIGGYAVGVHGRPRATKDLDLLLEPLTAPVRDRACQALETFGAPTETISAVRGVQPNEIVWFGIPPLRVDMLSGLPALNFEQAWPRRVELEVEGQIVHVVGLDDLIALKRAAGRPQDLADVRALSRTR